MIIEAQPYGVHPDDLDFVVECMQNGKVGIMPTDSVYAYCALSDQKGAFDQMCRLKHIDPKDAMMSIVCRDLSQASHYFSQWETPTYRILNKNLPGPFTFILNAGNRAPSFLKNKRKTLGLRIPNHPVIKSVMNRFEIPLLVSSVINEDEITPFFSDADLLIRQHEKQVAFIIIEEHMEQEESTVVDLTSGEPVILRQTRHELKY